MKSQRVRENLIVRTIILCSAIILSAGIGIFGADAVIQGKIGVINEIIQPKAKSAVKSEFVEYLPSPISTPMPKSIVRPVKFPSPTPDSDPLTTCQFKYIPHRQMKSSECKRSTECQLVQGGERFFSPSVEECKKAQETYWASQKQESRPIQQPIIPKPDNSSKIAAITNLLVEIINLNGLIQIETTKLQDAYRMNSELNSFCEADRDKLYSEGLLSPQQIGDLLDRCRTSGYSLQPMLTSINNAKNRISQLNSQIQNIIASCVGVECNQEYDKAVKLIEGKGFMVR